MNTRVQEEIAAIAVSDQNEKALVGMANQIASYWHALRRRGIPLEMCEQLTLQTNQILAEVLIGE